MSSIAIAPEWEVWQCAASPRIEYARSVMDGLRIAATDGFLRLAHGGVEIGGVLFGTYQGECVRILAHRPLACEHALGPSFTLSASDERALAELIASAEHDTELAGLRAVGWYHSHTRSEIFLSDKDLDLFARHFPEPWQIALVLRPHKFDPVRAGFFYREPDGSVHAAGSRQEIELIAPKCTAAPVERFEHVQRELEPAAVPSDPPPLVVVAPDPEPPSFLSAHEGLPARRRRLGPWLWLSAAALLSASGVFWMLASRTPPGLDLRATDVDGQLRIEWDRNSPVVRLSAGAVLDIDDGDFKLHDALSPEHLRAGNVTYLRSTGTVVVRLAVHDMSGEVTSEMTRFLGRPVVVPVQSPPPQPAPSAAPESVAGSAERSAAVEDAKPTRAPRDEAPPTKSAPPPSPRRTLILPPTAAPQTQTAVLAPPPIAATAAVPTVIPKIPAPVATPPVAAPPVATPSVTPPPVVQGPTSGKLIWTGRLAHGATLQIHGNRASSGTLNGAFPGGPVRIQIFPTELTQDGLRIFTADARSVAPTEAPGVDNGWNRTDYVLNPRKAADLRIVESPSEKNDWSAITLRAERGDHNIIILRWDRR